MGNSPRKINELVDLHITQQNYRTLEADLEILLRYIDLTEVNYLVNSAEVRKLILASCSLIESIIPHLKESIGEQEDKLNSESIAAYIYRITESSGFKLTNLQPILFGKKFNPWQNYSKWWNAYNAIKHPERDQTGIEFFGSAIESVLAYFILVVLLTRGTKISLFWHESDIVKISDETSERHIDYQNNMSLENILKWNRDD